MSFFSFTEIKRDCTSPWHLLFSGWRDLVYSLRLEFLIKRKFLIPHIISENLKCDSCSKIYMHTICSFSFLIHYMSNNGLKPSAERRDALLYYELWKCSASLSQKGTLLLWCIETVKLDTFLVEDSKCEHSRKLIFLVFF